MGVPVTVSDVLFVVILMPSDMKVLQWVQTPVEVLWPSAGEVVLITSLTPSDVQITAVFKSATEWSWPGAVIASVYEWLQELQVYVLVPSVVQVASCVICSVYTWSRMASA